MPERWKLRLIRHFWRPSYFEELLKRLEKNTDIDAITFDSDKKRFYEMKKMNKDKVIAGRSVLEILNRFDKKIKDPRSFTDGKRIVKIIKSFLKINCKISKLDEILLKFAKKNDLTKNIFKDFKSIQNLKRLKQDVNFIANFGRDLEYYTGIVFEVSSGNKEIARGGRYDDLLKSLGAKKNIPAVGANNYFKKHMKDLITIGLPSKGRLKDKAISFFDNSGLKILQSEKERNYFGSIENKSNIKVIFLHAKEIIQRLGDGTLDVGISGLDLLSESDNNLRDKIAIKRKLDFGNANLVVAVPDDWIDVQTIADLEEVSFDLRFKRNSRLRVATKYPNLTNNFLISKGVTQHKIIPSLGATETYPFIGSSEIIVDISSTGKTLADNNLRLLKDGLILKSTACLFYVKKRPQN